MHQKRADLAWVALIRKLVAGIPIKTELRDVTGHLGDHHNFDDLYPASQLSARAGHEAKHCLCHLTPQLEPPQCPQEIFKEGWSCWVGDAKVTTGPKGAVLKRSHPHRMKEHCRAKERLPPAAFDLISWGRAEGAASACLGLLNLWMTKQVSGFCPAGKMMKRRGLWEGGKRHSCKEASKDVEHTLHCPRPDRAQTWQSAVDGLEEWMKVTDTDPAAQRCALAVTQARDPGTIF